ncbi:DUF748 domain-containing protein [Polynucleobacter sp. AP-Nino-20-G2]|uniref:DUF748 domain-containing protein n=1 Tax=Polynucleobacter sp. AP-Nino-20-G2 TaxID=2576917 RepID=UPI001BFEB23C|nr:DUF748 domain-containing protein [Polynucleobacter sp. AP-Nino-20-G2]QWE17345.1 DUF748 domain-containing protein [Polynucleobacter sp. AP-Nino-20-G2]
MISFKRLAVGTWLLRITGGILALLFLFWGVCHLWVPGAIKSAVESYGKKIGYEITYQDLSISPLRLRIEIDGLRVIDGHQEKLLGLKKAVVMLKWSRLAIGELGFEEVLFDEPNVLLEKRGAKGSASQWNWQELIVAITRSVPPSDPTALKKNFKISIDEFRVSDAGLEVVDLNKKLHEQLKSFSIELLDIANYDKRGDVNGVRGQYGLNLGALHFNLPGLNQKIAFRHVAIKGALDNPAPDVIGAQLDLEVDDGRVNSHWDLKSDKSIAGRVQVENFSLAPFIGLLPANKELQARGGVIQSALEIGLKGDELTVSGDLHLLDLDLHEQGQKQSLMKWKSGDIQQFIYQNSKRAGSSLIANAISIDQPVLQFEIDDKGFSNFRRLFSKGGSEVAGVDRLPAPSKEKTSFALDIKVLKLREGEVRFADLAMKPNFKVNLRKFNASFTNVSALPGHSTAMTLDGVLADSGSLRGRGQISFDDPRRNNDVTLNFKNIPLNAFNPAVMTFAGYQIASGRVNLNLHYSAKDGELKGGNQIIIKKIELGEEVADFQGKKLPLGLAIALLEDSDDTIDVTINIAGNVDAPEFSASGLLWQAISNILTNVATAPFRALGALLGMGADDGVNAILGEAVFLPADQDRLEKFGDFLAKKPNATLELAGTYDPVADKAALARATADLAILKAAGMNIAPNDPIPSPDFLDSKVQSGLKSVYAQYVGRIKLGQRLLTLPAGAERNEQLHTELIASIPVSVEDLTGLANNRAKLALSFMVKSNPALKDRISLGEVKTVTAGKEGVPLEVEVRIK